MWAVNYSMRILEPFTTFPISPSKKEQRQFPPWCLPVLQSSSQWDWNKQLIPCLLWFSERGKKGNKRPGKTRLGDFWACWVVWLWLANGIILSVGREQCRGFLGIVRAELLWSLGLGHKIHKGVAISKVRLVQPNFGFGLVLVTHYDLRGKSIKSFLPVWTQISFFCVSCGWSLARRKNNVCLFTFWSFANSLVTGGPYRKAKTPFQTPKKPTKEMPPKTTQHVCALDLSFSKLARSVCIFSWWKLKLERFHTLTVAAIRRSWKFSLCCVFFQWVHEGNLTLKEQTVVSLVDFWSV